MDMICRNCNSPIRDGSAFCTKCGAKVQAPAPQQRAPASRPAAAPIPQPAPAQRPAPQPQPKKKSSAGIWIGIILTLLIIGGEAWYLVNWYNNEGGFFPEAASVSREDSDDESDNEKHKDKDRDKEKDKSEPDGETSEEDGGAVSDPASSPSHAGKLPDGAEQMSGATAKDLAGDWIGEITLTKMQGYEELPGAPDNIKELIAEAMSKPQKYSMSFDENGRWDLFIDYMFGMRFSSTELRLDDPKTPEEETAHLYKGPENGVITISMSYFDASGAGGGDFLIKANIFTDGEGIGISGKLSVTITNQGQSISLDGDFTLRPDKGEE